MQVPVRPELLLKHFGREYHVTMSLTMTCLHSKYTALPINTHFIITRLKLNKKTCSPGLGQVQYHITQAHARTRKHAHTHTHTQSNYKVAVSRLDETKRDNSRIYAGFQASAALYIRSVLFRCFMQRRMNGSLLRTFRDR